jgi:hypothetical protein
MSEQKEHIAILIDAMKIEQGEKRETGVRLYQSLTCTGSLGPSEIVFLAPKGIKYSDDHPSLENLRKAFRSFSGVERPCTAIVWFRSHFDDRAAHLPDGGLSFSELSESMSSLGCDRMDIILEGPGSDRAAEDLLKKGWRVLYSKRADGGMKTADPFDAPSVFKGDRIDNSLIFAERKRLEREGFLLQWSGEGPRGEDKT